jgi:cytochrome c oxidase cbb3-type subunit 3
MKSWMMLIPLVLGCTDKDTDTGADAVAAILALSGDASSGASLYASSCSGCHGVDGEGVSAPAMAEVVSENSDEEIVSAIYSGEGSGMPAYGGTLSDQDIADLLEYLTATF